MEKDRSRTPLDLGAIGREFERMMSLGDDYVDPLEFEGGKGDIELISTIAYYPSQKRMEVIPAGEEVPTEQR